MGGDRAADLFDDLDEIVITPSLQSSSSDDERLLRQTLRGVETVLGKGDSPRAAEDTPTDDSEDGNNASPRWYRIASANSPNRQADKLPKNQHGYISQAPDLDDNSPGQWMQRNDSHDSPFRASVPLDDNSPGQWMQRNDPARTSLPHEEDLRTVPSSNSRSTNQYKMLGPRDFDQPADADHLLSAVTPQSIATPQSTVTHQVITTPQSVASVTHQVITTPQSVASVHSNDNLPFTKAPSRKSFRGPDHSSSNSSVDSNSYLQGLAKRPPLETPSPDSYSQMPSLLMHTDLDTPNTRPEARPTLSMHKDIDRPSQSRLTDLESPSPSNGGDADSPSPSSYANLDSPPHSRYRDLNPPSQPAHKSLDSPSPYADVNISSPTDLEDSYVFAHHVTTREEETPSRHSRETPLGLFDESPFRGREETPSGHREETPSGHRDETPLRLRDETPVTRRDDTLLSCTEPEVVDVSPLVLEGHRSHRSSRVSSRSSHKLEHARPHLLASHRDEPSQPKSLVHGGSSHSRRSVAGGPSHRSSLSHNRPSQSSEGSTSQHPAVVASQRSSRSSQRSLEEKSPRGLTSHEEAVLKQKPFPAAVGGPFSHLKPRSFLDKAQPYSHDVLTEESITSSSVDVSSANVARIQVSSNKRPSIVSSRGNRASNPRSSGDKSQSGSRHLTRFTDTRPPSLPLKSEASTAKSELQDSFPAELPPRFQNRRTSSPQNVRVSSYANTSQDLDSRDMDSPLGDMDSPLGDMDAARQYRINSTHSSRHESIGPYQTGGRPAMSPHTFDSRDAPSPYALSDHGGERQPSHNVSSYDEERRPAHTGGRVSAHGDVRHSHVSHMGGTSHMSHPSHVSGTSHRSDGGASRDGASHGVKSQGGAYRCSHGKVSSSHGGSEHNSTSISVGEDGRASRRWALSKQGGSRGSVSAESRGGVGKPAIPTSVLDDMGRPKTPRFISSWKDDRNANYIGHWQWACLWSDVTLKLSLARRAAKPQELLFVIRVAGTGNRTRGDNMLEKSQVSTKRSWKREAIDEYQNETAWPPYKEHKELSPPTSASSIRDRFHHGKQEIIFLRTIVEGKWSEQGRLHFLLLSIAEMFGTEVPDAFGISECAARLFASGPPGDLERLFELGDGLCTDREEKRARPAYRWTSLLEVPETSFQFMRHSGCSNYGELLCRWISVPGYPFLDETPDYADHAKTGLLETLEEAAAQPDLEMETSHLGPEGFKSGPQIGGVVTAGLSPIVVPGASEMELRRLRNASVREGFRFFFWQARTGEEAAAFFLINVITGKCLVFRVQQPATPLTLCRALRCLLLHLRFPSAQMLTTAPLYNDFLRLSKCGTGPEADWPMLERLLQQWSLDHKASPWQTLMTSKQHFHSLDLHTVERHQSDFYITLQMFDRLRTRSSPLPKLLEAASLRVLKPGASSHDAHALSSVFACFRCALWFLQEIFTYEQAELKQAASGALAAQRKSSVATTSSKKAFERGIGQQRDTFVAGCFIDCADLRTKRREQIRSDEHDGLAHERQPLSALMANLDVTLNLDATPALKKEAHLKAQKKQVVKRSKIFVPPLASMAAAPLVAFAAEGVDPAVQATLPPRDLDSMSIAMQTNGSFLVSTNVPRDPTVNSRLFGSSARGDAALFDRPSHKKKSGHRTSGVYDASLQNAFTSTIQTTAMGDGRPAFYIQQDHFPPATQWPPTNDQFFPGTSGHQKRPLFQPLFTLVPTPPQPYY